jgi:hypothetical protein
MTPPSIRRIPAPEPRALASSTRARRPRPRPHSRCFPLSVSSPTAPPHRHHPRNPVSCATDPLSPRFHSTRHGSTLAPASTRLDTISPGALFSVFSRFFFPSPQRGSVEHHTPETLPPISRCPGSSLAPSPAPVPLLSSGSPSFFLSLSLRFGSCLRASPSVSSRASLVPRAVSVQFPVSSPGPFPSCLVPAGPSSCAPPVSVVCSARFRRVPRPLCACFRGSFRAVVRAVVPPRSQSGRRCRTVPSHGRRLFRGHSGVYVCALSPLLLSPCRTVLLPSALLAGSWCLLDASPRAFPTEIVDDALGTAGR